MLFTREAFTDYVSWLMFSRPPWLDILVHPLTRSQLLDHTGRALWFGTPLAIDCVILEEADARLSPPDEARNRSSKAPRHTGAVAQGRTEGVWAVTGERGENFCGVGVCFEAKNRRHDRRLWVETFIVLEMPKMLITRLRLYAST